MKKAFPSHLSLGKKVERIRKIKGLKQETLAKALGVTPQAISKMEQSENIDEDKLALIAHVLGTSSECIKEFDEKIMFDHILNNKGAALNHAEHYNFNLINKIVELYDALVKSEQEKVAILNNFLNKK